MAESVKVDILKNQRNPGNMFLRCLSHRGLHRLSTLTSFGASYFCHYLFLLLLRLQIMPNNRFQAWYKKTLFLETLQEGPITGIKEHPE